ncbi:bile acid:sodium symporter family protein [Pseudonocardia oroxyli]|uniref:Solute carrier family 10 (Sodium/bile acid cotransporter), member 7 n=1 Tax=Pseudonocardia oroxyli TaxID=366584 RepID=A0A1G7HLD4_PSEOR|nr:bile acid:sodium symporter family protein [Pseudonocardia oroxyli]SDF01181.1 solute carrier family 10 (sodium/bile acid cotransporter), member 7 [Pseudonocardia oroxyli]
MKRVDPFLLMILATVGVAALLPASGSVATGFSYATSVAIALLFFLYGARLSTREAVEGLKHWRLHGTVVAATFVLFPLLGLLIQLIPAAILPTELKLGLLFLCCLPSTVQSSIAFTSVARGNVPAAICAASLSNLLGIVLTPLLTGLLLSAQGGFSARALLDVALQLLAPFVLGQLLRRWIGDWVARNRNWLKIVDRGSILLVVYVAFSEGMTQGIWGRLSLGALAALVGTCVVLLAVVLAITWFVPRRFTRADRITILFCGSKKSLASGLPMAGVLFSAGQVGLLVLPLMLFHQIQLMACAVIAGRLARQAEEPVAVPA